LNFSDDDERNTGNGHDDEDDDEREGGRDDDNDDDDDYDGTRRPRFLFLLFSHILLVCFHCLLLKIYHVANKKAGWIREVMCFRILCRWWP